jgi:Ca-activated chloride channel family protein
MFRARLEASRVKAGEPRSLGLLVEAAAPAMPQQQSTRNPQAIVFVVDRSGSMGGGRLDLIKNAIGEMIGQLSPSDFVSVISFDDRVETHVPLRQKGTLNSADLRRVLAQLEPRGATNLELGYRHGLAEAAKAPDGVEGQLILLSDGHANRGIKDPVQLGQLAALATEHLVSTSTMGIGTGFDETLLTSVASSGQGNHFAAVKVEEAVAGLQDEIDGLLQRSLRNIKCVITSWQEKSLISLTPVGYVQSKRNLSDGIEVSLGELVSGEERGYAFALELNTEGSDQTGVIELEIHVSGENALNGEAFSQVIQLEIDVVSPEGFVAPELDEDVVAELAVFRMANQKNQAAQAARDGSLGLAREIIANAQSDTTAMLEQLDKLSPRVRMRVLAENRELAELMGFTDLEFAKRATESSYRSARSKSNPRDKN